MASIRPEIGTTVTLEANGGAITAGSIAAADDATYNPATSGYFFAEFELTAGFGANPVVGTLVELYGLPALDGTNYAAIATAALPQATRLGAFEVMLAQTATQRMIVEAPLLSPSLTMFYLKNGTAQTLSAGWLLKMKPVRTQTV